MNYTKLSDLIDQQFTVQEVLGFGFKKWDETQNTMLFSKDYVQGYRKVWGVETDKGKLDLGSGQMGNLLEAVCFKGTSELIGKTFQVKSNGKTGKDIRYFLNFVKPEKTAPEPISGMDAKKFGPPPHKPSDPGAYNNPNPAFQGQAETPMGDKNDPLPF